VGYTWGIGGRPTYNEFSLGAVDSKISTRVFLEQGFIRSNKVYLQITGIIFYREIDGDYIAVADKSLNAGWLELVQAIKTDLKEILPPAVLYANRCQILRRAFGLPDIK
jgi:hypothetical protein